MPHSLWDDSLVWTSGWYIRVGDVWRRSVGRIETGGAYFALPVYGEYGDERTSVSVDAAEEIVYVRASADFRGYRFNMGAMTTEDGHRVRCAPSDASRIFVFLFRDESDNREVAAVIPGAEYHDPRSYYPGVTVTAPVANLDNYSKEIEWIRGVRQA